MGRIPRVPVPRVRPVARTGRTAGGRPPPGTTNNTSSVVSWQNTGGLVTNPIPVPAIKVTPTWQLMLRIWPLEDRPEEMTVESTVNSLNFDQMITWKEQYEAQIKKEGKGDGLFGKDNPIPKKEYEKGEDNCAELLHPARFERAPILERKKYWQMVPIKRSHTYRRLSLEHAGAEGKVSEVTLMRAHDRSMPLTLKMFATSNKYRKSFGQTETKDAAHDWDIPKSTWDIQEAILNFMDVYADLWHMDDTPRILSRILIHYKYGALLKVIVYILYYTLQFIIVV